MKRFLGILCMVLLFVTQPLNAQMKLRLGVVGGTTLKEAKVNQSLKKSNWQGWYAGPVLELSLPLGLKVDGSVQYAHNELDTGNDKVDLNYVSIPFNLKLNFSLLGILGMYVSAGPQFDNKINASGHLFDAENFKLRKRTKSLNIGAGLRFSKHFQVGAYYNIPQNRAEGDASEQEDGHMFKENTWKIGAMILF